MEENITRLRRANTLALYRDWAQEKLAAGDASKGLEQAFAATIELSPSRWSQIKSSRPIGDLLARQIESHAGKARGWLDLTHEGSAFADDAEMHFLELARRAWRNSSSRQRRELLKTVRQVEERLKGE